MIGVRTNVTYRTNGQFYNKIPPNTSLVVAVQKHLQHARTTEYITKRAFTNTTHVIVYSRHYAIVDILDNYNLNQYLIDFYMKNTFQLDLLGNLLLKIQLVM
jgi:hypothetical protein